MELSRNQKLMMEYVLVSNELRAVRKRKRALSNQAKKAISAELAVEVLQGVRDYQGIAMISTRTKKLIHNRLVALGGLISKVYSIATSAAVEEEKIKLGERARFVRSYDTHGLLKEHESILPEITRTGQLFGLSILGYDGYELHLMGNLAETLRRRQSRKYLLKRLPDWSMVAMMRYLNEVTVHSSECLEFLEKTKPIEEVDGE